MTTAQAIAETPAQVTGASLPERAFGGAGAPSPIGVGNKALDPEPKVPTGFPTNGDTYGILSSGEINTIASELTNTTPSRSFAFKLSGTGKALLAKKGELTVPITLTFTPDGGTAASQVKSVTFKKAAKSCKKAKAKAKAKSSAKKKCKAPAAKGKNKKK